MILQALLAIATLGIAAEYPVVSLFIPNADPQSLLGEVLAAVRVNVNDPRIRQLIRNSNQQQLHTVSIARSEKLIAQNVVWALAYF